MTNSFLRTIIICLTIFVIGLKSNAQFSKTHYIPPITAFDHTNSDPLDQYLYISTPSTSPVNIKIRPIGGTTINVTASKSAPYKHSIGSGHDSQLFIHEDRTNRVRSDKGFIIEAEDLVYVTLKLNGGGNAQAGALVSKGIAGLGKEFRTGSFYNPHETQAALSFISVMATENNTEVTIKDIPNGMTLANGEKSNIGSVIKLNNGESYVIAIKVSSGVINQDAFLGALVESNKLIAVNCGSLNGTNSISSGARDYGFDQIVPTDRIGNEYVFTRAFGNDEIENPLIVAHEDDTDIYIRGDNSTGTFVANIDAGEYFAIQGNEYNSIVAGGNLYVWTSKNVFAYQGVGGRDNAANQGMFFVPPLNCETPIVVDNIPLIQEIGSRDFEGGLSILTKSDAVLKVNGTTVVGSGMDYIGPTTVDGKTHYVTYLIRDLSGNVSIESTKEVYVAAFGFNGSAAFGGYYSGFSIKPEVFFDSALSSDGCLPGVKLGLNSLTSFDIFQWYKDGAAIPGETNNSYEPSEPGYYYVKGTIICNGRELDSDEIPVSNCTETDIYDIPVNIDLDYDNDGILNCDESLGEFPFDLSNTSGSNFNSGEYIYDYDVSIINTAASTPFIGVNDGTFSMKVPAGVTNSVVYESNFNKALNVKIQYPTTAISSNSEFTSEEYFTINVPSDKTITIYNPDNQLLIDTNYDGIYESGITEFSAFEVRIKSNSNSIDFGTGTFSISAYQVESIKVTLTNNSDFEANKASLQILTSCIPTDTDGDTIPDYWDLDSDNDGIPDMIEAQGKIFTVATTDSNNDGLFDAFETSSQNIVDTDSDTVPDYLDLDSDNDGIYDLFESNSSALDVNLDGVIDGNSLFFGANGLSNSVETSADSGVINYTILDSDSDTFPNSVEIDSDNDNCYDVVEAGFTDDNDNGLLGDNSPITNSNGKVTSGSDGYTFPNSNYRIGSPMEITEQPVSQLVCELKSTTFKISSNATGFQWQVSHNGVTWNDVIENSIYSGTTTNTLSIDKANFGLNNNLYRVVLSKTGNTCGLISDSVTLTVDKNTTVISFDTAGPFCTSDPNITLTATPTGGVFSGTGVTSSGVFSPTDAFVGDHTITYTLTNSNGCKISSDITIKVNAIPDPAIVNSIQTFCSSPTSTLTVANLSVNNQGANNVNWYASSTNGTKLNSSDPLVHNTIYFAELENANGCVSDTRTETTVFLSSPEITASDDEICFGDTTKLTVNGVPETPEDFKIAHPELTYLTKHNDSHYFYQENSISWEAANTIGDNLPGASMYIINNTAEESAVHNAIQAKGLTGNDGISFWFGLKQNNTATDYSEPSGGWYWVDGTPLIYKNWATSEPNDWPNSNINNEENYGQFEFSANGKKWNDAANNDINTNSYPIFEFTGTTDVVWGHYNNVGDEVLFTNATSSLEVSPTETTTYFIKVTTNGVVCTNEITITVNPLPTFTVTDPGPMCNNADPIQLKISPKDGTYSGTGVNATGLFTPSDANVGTNTITYSYTDDKGCTTSQELDILIYEVPTIVFTPQNEVCANGNSIQLEATPVGGVFSGTGVNASGLFDPTIALQGNHDILYTYTTDKGCISTGIQTIVVNPEPTIIFDAVDEICINASSINFNATPINGEYSGNGVTKNGLFTPADAGEGIHVITYTYTDGNSCTSTKDVTITVNKLGVVTITPVQPLCVDAPITTLTASPIGGEFSGTGIDKSGQFNPSTAGVGTHNITYEYKDTNNCSATNTIQVVVNPLPVVNFPTQNPLCVDNTEVQLNATPINGTYSGLGVSSSGLFNPANAGIGNHIIKYIFTDINGCSDFKEITITVHPLPTVTLQKEGPFCIDANSKTLTASPIGGIFSGPGVNPNTGVFTPSVATAGSHEIIYTYEDNNGCKNSDSITIIVNPLPTLSFDQPAPFCLDDSSKQLLALPLDGEFSGTGVSISGVFNPQSAGVGTHRITYTYSDINGCENSIIRDIIVNQLPTLSVTNSNLCIGDFIDLKLLSSTSSGIDLTYFLTEIEAESDLNAIADTNVKPSATRSYFVKATNPSSTCSVIKELVITVVDLPTLTPVKIIQCDDDDLADGYTFFNLRVKESLISDNYLNETFTYYKTELGAINRDASEKIDNPLAYKNTTINTDTVWVSVQNKYECLEVTQIDIEVTATDLNDGFIIPYTECDDYLDLDGNNNGNNDDTDGITTFDFSNATNQISTTLPIGQKFTISYYRNEADGLAEINPIDPTNYRNIGYPNSQAIYVRVDSDINDACYGFGPHVFLTTNPIPKFNPIIDLKLCDDDTDGYVAGFDLSAQTKSILGSQAMENCTVTYHKTANDASIGIDPLANLYTNEIADRQTIYVRIVNNDTSCVNPHGKFDIVVNPLPTFNTIPAYEVCDDDTLDGFVNAFDLSTKTPSILGALQKEEDFIVTYHRTLIEAENNSNPILDPIYTNENKSSQTIYVRIENKTTTCINDKGTLELIVNSPPDFSVEENQIVCIDNPYGLDLTIISAADSYQYEWFNSKGVSLGFGDTVKVFQKDLYTVKATIVASPECPVFKKILVKESSAPTITNFKVTDGFNLGSILVFVDGIGEFEYQLNGGAYQSAPLFENLLTGSYTISVNDTNGCGSDTRTDITVIIFEKYFTPNNDGHGKNEWGIGVDSSKFRTGLIKIFDRSGRLLKIINPLSNNPNENSWDGTFNGKQMPATDYWFSLELTDNKGETIVKTGNFSLIL
jgi:gliding motility-associated-like protein